MSKRVKSTVDEADRARIASAAAALFASLGQPTTLVSVPEKTAETEDAVFKRPQPRPPKSTAPVKTKKRAKPLEILSHTATTAKPWTPVLDTPMAIQTPSSSSSSSSTESTDRVDHSDAVLSTDAKSQTHVPLSSAQQQQQQQQSLNTVHPDDETLEQTLARLSRLPDEARNPTGRSAPILLDDDLGRKRTRKMASKPWPNLPVLGEVSYTYDDKDILGKVHCLHCQRKIEICAVHIPLAKRHDERYKLWRGGSFDTLSCGKTYLMAHPNIFVIEKCLPLFDEMAWVVYGERNVPPAPEQHLLWLYNIHGITYEQFDDYVNRNIMVLTLNPPFVWEEMSIVEQQLGLTPLPTFLTQGPLSSSSSSSSSSESALVPQQQTTDTIAVVAKKSQTLSSRVYNTSLVPFGAGLPLTSFFHPVKMETT